MDLERKLLIDRNERVSTFPRPDYSKMSNEMLKKRAEILEKTFDELFGEGSNEKNNV